MELLVGVCALRERVVGVWNGEVWEGVGGAVGGEYVECGVDDEGEGVLFGALGRGRMRRWGGGVGERDAL